MAGQIYAGAVGTVPLNGQIQYFHGIQPAPIFPIESSGTPVGRRYQGSPIFRFIGSGLADSLYAGSVYGQKQGRRLAFFTLLWDHAIILNASVNLAEKGLLVMFGGLPAIENHLSRIGHILPHPK